MYTLDGYLPEREARAERAYLEAYRTEYARLYESERATNRDLLLYWSGLAHWAGCAARVTELGRVPAHPSNRLAADPAPEIDALRQELGGGA